MFKTIIKTLNILLFILFFSCLYAQKEGNVWCFSDSCGLDFNFSPPKVLINGVSNIPNEVATTISSKDGNMLFYIDRQNRVPLGWLPDTYYGRLINTNHQTLKKSDSLSIFYSGTQGALILPKPGNKSIYYLFHQAERLFPSPGDPFVFNEEFAHAYSIVDMSLDNGLGEMVSKNNVLINEWLSEKMIAIRHGNGRDWWVLLHGKADLFYKVLLTPKGIETISTQSIGPLYNYGIGLNFCNWGQMASSHDGSKLALVTLSGNIDIFDFDRCNGDISNWQPINPQGLDNYYGCAFSPNGNYLYVANEHSPYCLFQFDLTFTNIQSSRITIAQNSFDCYFGQIKLAPDGKIYISNYQSEYIHVIHNPNSPGLFCDFEANAINFAGKKIRGGLPNIPNFELGAMEGSACDTIPPITPEDTAEATPEVFIPNIFSPNNDGQNDVFYVYSNNIKTMTLKIFNRWGERVFETNNINNGWDGTYNGKPVQLGVYTYYFEAELMSGEKYIKRGNVSLVK